MSESDFQFDDLDLEQIEGEAAEALSRRKTNLYADVDAKLDKALEAAALRIEGREYETRDIRQTVDEVMKDFRVDERDLSAATNKLYEYAEAQGAQLASLETMQHPAALRIIKDAEKAVEDAQSNVNKGEVALGTANNIGLWAGLFGRKAAAIAAAERQLQGAKAERERAKQELEEAPAKAAAKHREMLMNATMEESNQRIQLMHENANAILRENMDSAQQAADRRVAVIETTRTRLTAVTAQSQTAEAELNELRPKADAIQAKLDSGEVERQTEKYRQLEAELSTQNTRLAELKGEMDAAMGEAQELEEKLEALEMQRDALLTLKANYERSYRIGTAAAKINSEIASVRLELIQGMSDLQIQTELNKVSRDNTLSAHQNAADLINAVERDRIQYLEDHPELMKALNTVKDHLADARELIAEQDEKLRDEWNRGDYSAGGEKPEDQAESKEAFSL